MPLTIVSSDTYYLNGNSTITSNGTAQEPQKSSDNIYSCPTNHPNAPVNKVMSVKIDLSRNKVSCCYVGESDANGQRCSYVQTYIFNKPITPIYADTVQYYNVNDWTKTDEASTFFYDGITKVEGTKGIGYNGIIPDQQYKTCDKVMILNDRLTSVPKQCRWK